MNRLNEKQINALSDLMVAMNENKDEETGEVRDVAKDRSFGSTGELARQMAEFVDLSVLGWMEREYAEKGTEFDETEWANEVREWMTNRVVQMASSPEESTSPLHNLRERYYLAALAEFLRGSFISGSAVSAAVNTLAKG